MALVKFKKSAIIWLISTLFFACKPEVERYPVSFNKIWDNGMHIQVDKINQNTKMVGLLSKKVYRTTHTYSYSLMVDDGDINWEGGSAEPKHLLLCNDSIYLHSLKLKVQHTDPTDSLSSRKQAAYYVIEHAYQVYIDERYFFNWFGDDFWVDVSPEIYEQRKVECVEYPIPNDEELNLLN